MILKSLFATALLILSSTFTYAAVIEHKGFSRNESSTIVAGNQLEWLMWDQTVGLSIQEALDSYGGIEQGGWRVATGFEIAGLLNSFDMGHTDWDPVFGWREYTLTAWQPGEDGPHDWFVKLFGSTLSTPDYWGVGDPWVEASALFKSSHIYWKEAGMVTVVKDRDRSYGFYESALAQLYNEGYRETGREGTGVALVRSTTPNPKPVSVPSLIGLLAVGIALLGLQRRRPLSCLTA